MNMNLLKWVGMAVAGIFVAGVAGNEVGKEVGKYFGGSADESSVEEEIAED